MATGGEDTSILPLQQERSVIFRNSSANADDSSARVLPLREITEADERTCGTGLFCLPSRNGSRRITESPEKTRKYIDKPSEKTVDMLMCSSFMVGLGIALSVLIFTYGNPVVGPIRPPTNATYIDMTYPFDDETIYWPSLPRFKLTRFIKKQLSNGTWYQMNTFCSAEHGGTHLDAPSHFDVENGTTIDELTLDKLIGPACVLDITAKASKNSDALVTKDDVTDYEKVHGEIPKGSFVFMLSGWGKRWPDPLTYLGNDKDVVTKMHFPGFDADAATFLVTQRQVAGLGVDTASVDYGQSKEFLVHRVLSAASLVGLENVANLDQLPASGATVYALPMKIKGGTGAPVRLFAIVNRN